MTNQNSKNLAYEVEFSLIGSLLVSRLNSAAREAIEWLTPEMFATAQLGAIFGAIKKQALKDNLIDIVFLNSDYGQDFGMLAEITSKTYSAANLRGYAEKVMQFYQRREAQKIFIRVADALNKNHADKVDVEIDKGLAELSRLSAKSEKVTPLAMSELLDGYVDLIEERAKPTFKDRLLFTGNQALDERLGGIGETDICIVAGRPGMGKTETAITFTKNILEQGGSVLFFSLEMSKEQILDRLVASVGGLNSSKIRNPEKMNDEDFALLGNGINKLYDKNLFIVDKSGLDMNRIINIAERHLSEKGKLKAVVIDYIGLVRHGELSGKINRTYQIADSMEKLKTFTKDNHVPVILLAQLNRGAENSRPTNADLRDSGSLEQDASQIIMVHNQRDKENGGPSKYTEWVVTKNRFGTNGVAYVEFRHGQFIECDQQLANEELTRKDDKPRAYIKTYGKAA